MDNGQNKQTAETYPAVGAENFLTKQNTEPASSQNQNTWANEHNTRAIGDSAMHLPEQPTLEQVASPEREQMAASKQPPMGQIFSVEPSSTSEHETNHEATFDASAVRMDGDRLSSDTLGLAKDAENQLISTGDAGQFVREIYQIREALTKTITGKAA